MLEKLQCLYRSDNNVAQVKDKECCFSNNEPEHVDLATGKYNEQKRRKKKKKTYERKYAQNIDDLHSNEQLLVFTLKVKEKTWMKVQDAQKAYYYF